MMAGFGISESLEGTHIVGRPSIVPFEVEERIPWEIGEVLDGRLRYGEMTF